MAQIQKEEVRERLLAGAEETFAREGYASATMAQIARAAGVSTGNIYRYFGGKEELFRTVFSDAFAATHLRLVRRRVAALVWDGDAIAVDPLARKEAGELLAFWIDHRLKVITILDRAEGSRFEGYGDVFVAELVRLTTTWLRAQNPELRLTRIARFTLLGIFQNSRRAIVSILETYDGVDEIRTAFEAFWSYQLAGLAGFTAWTTHE